MDPLNKEKHFIVTKLEFDEDEKVSLCLIEAVISHREIEIDWINLKDNNKWRQGWK